MAGIRLAYDSRFFNWICVAMRIIEVGMHWFPEGGGGADRYFLRLVLELVQERFFGEGSGFR